MLQNIWFFTPIILSAVCIPFVFRRAGFPKQLFWLMWLPAILTISSFAAVLMGERTLLGGPLGIWAIAAALLTLASVKWPRGKDSE